MVPGIRSSHMRQRRFSVFCASVLLGATLSLAGCAHTHGSDVLAKVNGKPIYAKDVQTYYENYLTPNQPRPSKEQADIVRLGIVRQLIDEEILAQRAAKLNLTATDEEVDSQVNEMKAPFTQEQFNQQLAQKHLTLSDLRQDIRRNKTTEKLLNKEINAKINITDGDISTYYNAHKADYNVTEPQYHLAEIAVTTSPQPPGQNNGVGNLQNSKATNDAEAKKKIDMLHNRLQSGEDFGTLAANFSERPDNASSGGDMGLVTDTQLKTDMSVYDAVVKLSPGQITDVMPVADPATHKILGYAIYRLLDKEAAGQRDLNDPRVQQSIRQQLRETRAQLLKNAYIEVLRDRAHVDNYFAEDVFKNGIQ